MSPMVSAVVPFYGVEEYIRSCLDSIRAQTLGDFEVILVDDGSPDASAEHAREVVELDGRFRLVTQENQGLGPARNKGAAHAAGRYLMFLDSDDLLAPRAFEQLVTSLERSGSDFAGGHVWRLSLARGLETSWAHEEPFAEHLQRTNIRQVPLLMRDRMVWNKMWRRSFWDGGGYAFPAIRFEDFPVTLKAHLEASAVDTLPEPLYVWRERPSGDSISQQGQHLANVDDRVTAALSVLDTVDSLGTDEVRELVHSHLVDVDVREVIAPLVACLPLDRPALEHRARTLAERIDPDLTGLAVPELVAAHRALCAGDFDRVHDIARFRAGVRTAQFLAAARRRPRPIPARAWRRGVTLAGSLAPPPRPRQGRLEDVTVLGRSLHYRLSVPMRRQVGAVVRAEVTIGLIRPAVQMSTLPDGVQLEVTVDTADLARLSAAPTPMRLDIAVGPLRWRGGVAVTPDQLHGARRAGAWVQALAHRGELAFTRIRRTSVIDRADIVGDHVRLHTDVADGTLVIERPWPTASTLVPIHDHIARLASTDLVTDDPADDPVSQIAQRRILLRRPLVPTTATVDESIILSGPGITTVVSDPRGGQRRVEICRDAHGQAVVVHEPYGEGRPSHRDRPWSPSEGEAPEAHMTPFDSE